MADPRDPYGGRDNRPPDQDTGSLLRDLRSLREAASPRPGVARPGPAPSQKPGGGGGRLIGGVLLVVVLVVGVAGYKAGVFDTTKPVRIDGSPRPTDAPSASPTGSTASAPPSPTPSESAPVSPDAPRTIAAGLVPAKLGAQYALAAFLLNRYDPAVKAADRFAQPASTELCAPAAGPAAWFAREAILFEDELSVTSAAATAPCTAFDAARRTQVQDALVKLASDHAGSPVDRAYGQMVTGQAEAAVSALAGPATETDKALALGLAHALTGAAPADVDKALAAAAKPNGLTLALRAHLAIMQDKRDDAARLLAEAMTAATGPDELYLSAGLAFRMGDYKLAQGLLERVQALHKNDPYAAYWRGLIDEKQGRTDDALSKYAEAQLSCADPKLLAAARTRRSLIHQKIGTDPDQSDREWKGAEDYDPYSMGVYLAHVQSVHFQADVSKPPERNPLFEEAMDRWQRMIVVYGPRDDFLKRYLSIFNELKDQGNARLGIQFLELLTEFGFVTAENPLKGNVDATLALLKDRVRPRQIWEAPPK